MDSKRLMELITYWQKKGRPEIVASLQRELDRALAAEAPKSQYTQGAIPQVKQPWREPPKQHPTPEQEYIMSDEEMFARGEGPYAGQYGMPMGGGMTEKEVEEPEVPDKESIPGGISKAYAAKPSPSQKEIYAPTPNGWQAAQNNFYGNTTDLGSLVGGMFNDTTNYNEDLLLPESQMTPDEIEANRLNSWSWSYDERDRKRKALAALKKKNPNLRY